MSRFANGCAVSRDTHKKTIGEDVKTVQFGWPLGMPLVAHLDGDVREVRIRLDTRSARILFSLEGNIMVLLHGFIKNNKRRRSRNLIWRKNG